MKLERNARVCTSFFPFWAVPYTFYTYYLSLYLMEGGITTAQTGLLMTIANASGLFFSFVAAPIVDKMGRKNSTLVFDLVSSAIPVFIFYLSQNFIAAILAQAITGMSRIMNTGYYLLMIEDSSDENSMNAMNLFNIILVAAGLTIPIASLIIERMGLVSGEKLFLLISFILMSGQAIIRHFLVQETPTGKAILESQDKLTLKQVLQTYKETFQYISKSRNVISAMVINAIIYVYYTTGTSISMFFAPYFSQFRNLEGVTLGLVGTIYAVGTLVSMVFINPHIKANNIYKYTIISSIASLLGFAILLLCPQGNNALLFVSITIIALSYGVLKTIADGVIAMEMDSRYSSGIYACSFILSSVLSILAIQAVQALYQISPNWLFGSSAVLVALVLVDALVFVKNSSKE